MNPYQMKKIDVSSMSPDEQRLFRLYGKLPSKSDHLAKHIKERKYFDSGDYALSKAGKASSVDTGSVGSEHPVPENIPHLSSPIIGNTHQGNIPVNNTVYTTATTSGMQNRSPIKESSFLGRETSFDEQSAKDIQENQESQQKK